MKNRYDVPLNYWSIENESQLRYAFQRVLVDSFYYSAFELHEEKSVFSAEKFRGRIDTYIRLTDIPSIVWIIEYKNAPLPPLVREQVAKYIDNVQPSPLGYSLVWKSGSSYFIEHFDLEHRSTALPIDSFFPTPSELLSLWRKRRPHLESDVGSRTETVPKLLQYCQDKRWDELIHGLEGGFTGRLHHSEQTNTRRLLDTTEALQKSTRVPREVLFHYHRLKGDILDCHNRLRESNISYSKCLEIAKKLRNRQYIALSQFLLGINQWRLGLVQVARRLHSDALEAAEAAITPNILSEQLLVELGLVSRNRSVISRVGLADNQQELGGLVSNTVDSQLTDICDQIIRVATTPSPQNYAALEIVALYKQIQHNFEGALAIHNKVLEYARVNNLHILEGWILNDLGLWHYAKGDMPAALREFSMSLEIKGRTGDNITMPVTVFNRALAYRRDNLVELFRRDRASAISQSYNLKDMEMYSYLKSCSD